MEFKLSEIEIDTLNKCIDSINFLFTPESIDKEFIFCQGSIGRSCKVRFTVFCAKNKRVKILKDITDYGSF